MLFERIEKESKDTVFVYTTCGSLEEAKRIGLTAVNEKLAISADYWIINSIYPWKGVVKEIDQCMLMFTTQKYLSDKLVKHIESEHSYNVPMIVKCDTAMTNQEYSFWVDNTLTSKEKYLTEAQAIEKKKNDEIGYRYDKLK